jgi:putative sterol carrier protein
MTKSELAAKLQNKNGWLPGKRIKIDFGSEGVVLLDGISECVAEADGPADTTIAISWDDLKALGRRELDPMAAMLQGRLRIAGDMSNALALAPILAKLRD